MTAERSKQAGFALYNMSPRAGTTMTAAVKQAPPLVTLAGRLPPPLPLRLPTGMMMSGYGGGGGVALPRSLGMPLGATLFLHELRNKAGQRRLCVVQRVPTENGPFVYPFALQIALYEPAGIWSDIAVTLRGVGRMPPLTPITSET